MQSSARSTSKVWVWETHCNIVYYTVFTLFTTIVFKTAEHSGNFWHLFVNYCVLFKNHNLITHYLSVACHQLFCFN